MVLEESMIFCCNSYSKLKLLVFIKLDVLSSLASRRLFNRLNVDIILEFNVLYLFSI